jgi:hypothetical protein
MPGVGLLHGVHAQGTDCIRQFAATGRLGSFHQGLGPIHDCFDVSNGPIGSPIKRGDILPQQTVHGK